MKIETKINLDDVLYKVLSERVQKYKVEEIRTSYTKSGLTVSYTCTDMKGDIKVISELDLSYYSLTPLEAVAKYTDFLSKKLEDDWNNQNK